MDRHGLLGTNARLETRGARVQSRLSSIDSFQHVKIPILLNIMSHAPMGRFQLELFIFITYFSTVVPSNVVFYFPAGLSSLTRNFEHVL